MKCHACGIEKDPEVKEIDPYDPLQTGLPRRPLADIECQPGGVTPSEGDWRVITLCRKCWHHLNPDMWTCQEHYEELNPVTPFNELPILTPDEDV